MGTRWNKRQKACATCSQWSAVRDVDLNCAMVQVEQGIKGKCISNHRQTNPTEWCLKYEPWIK